MLKAFKYRLSPTALQRVLIAKHIGSCRFVYNLALETKQAAYAGSRVNLSCFELIRQLPDLKKECAWLKEVNSQSLQQSVVNLDTAFTGFFKGQNDFPKFKKKTATQSFSIPQNIIVAGGKLVVPKFKEGIKIVLHRKMKGAVRQATISKTATGKYFVSIVCNTGEANKTKATIKASTTIGIDLGIKSFLASSDGQEYAHPKHLRVALSRLQYTQRKYAKNKGRRTRVRLALLHEKVTNKRKDFLHKTSTRLIRENQSIA